jgi:hypothetical protein
MLHGEARQLLPQGRDPMALYNYDLIVAIQVIFNRKKNLSN